MNETIITAEQFFVYGTLRPDCGSDQLWLGHADARHDGEAYVIGHKLVSRGWFPYMVPARGAQTVGCLIRPVSPVDYDRIMERFDRLEGVPSHYRRIDLAVMTPTGIERAWTYTPAGEQDSLLPEVPTNEAGFFDWHEWLRKRSTR